jgi:DNA-binding YbaB/EbfC family protein
MKFDLQSILQQVQQMQEEMEKRKKELDSKVVTAESGGGMVKVELTCNYRLTKLEISKELANPDDLEMLEDLIVAAVNKALQEATEVIEKEMGGVSSMMPNIPGLNL